MHCDNSSASELCVRERETSLPRYNMLLATYTTITIITTITTIITITTTTVSLLLAIFDERKNRKALAMMSLPRLLCEHAALAALSLGFHLGAFVTSSTNTALQSNLECSFTALRRNVSIISNAMMTSSLTVHGPRFTLLFCKKSWNRCITTLCAVSYTHHDGRSFSYLAGSQA